MDRLTIKEILERSIGHFEKYGIANPRLDAEVLLADLLGIERIQLYVRFDQPLTKAEVDQFRERLVLRSKRVPVQYITGHQEFMSLDFAVKKGVLIPRPETEHLVEAVIDYVKKSDLTAPLIADIGTGSGAIAVSLAHYLPLAKVVGVDISKEALAIAGENAEKHGLQERVSFFEGSFLAPLSKAGLVPDVIVSNPPYIRTQDLRGLQEEVRYEPSLALDGGSDGLIAYRQIIAQAKMLKSGGLLAFEVGAEQGEDVATLMQNDFVGVAILPDLAGIGRVVTGTKK